MGKGGDGRSVVAGTRSEKELGAARPNAGCKPLAWSQIEPHCSPDDAWIVHDGRVYDITGWCAVALPRPCLPPILMATADAATERLP